MKHQHSWIRLLIIYGGDYSLTEAVYWCRCGCAQVESKYDGRLISFKEFKPQAELLWSPEKS